MSFSNTRRHYTALDGLRGIAAIIVVLSHLGDSFNIHACVAHAHLAVEFFFMLSGFVIGYAYDRRWDDGMTIFGFFKRRLVRLHPLVPLGVFLGIVPVLLLNMAGLADVPVWQFVLIAIGCALMIPAFPVQSMNPFNGPVWTLFYEYFANVLYAVWLRRIGKKTLVALVSVAAVASALVAFRIDLFGLLLNFGYTYKAGWRFETSHFYLATTRLMFPFLTGLLICRLGTKIRVRNSFVPCAIAMVAILLFPPVDTWLPYSSIANGFYEYGMVLFVFPVLLMIGAGDESDDGGWVAKIAKFLGEISFPLYMTHYPFKNLLYWIYRNRAADWTNQRFFLVIVGFMAFAFAFAWLVMKFYCRPIGHWLVQKQEKDAKKGE